jgi:hypothetical protein
MMSHFGFRCSWFASVPLILFLCVGCDKQAATEQLEKVEQSAGETADAISDNVSDAVEKGGDIAGELGEKAMAYLTPLKEKFGDLETLKESPEKLKVAVSDLIEKIEGKAEGITLPESVSNALAAVKEKLIALRDDLGADIEQAKIDEHLKGIMDSVKSALGMSDK